MKHFTYDKPYAAMLCIYVACTLSALTLLPGAPVAISLLGFTCVTLIITFFYRSLPSYTRAGEIGLFVASLLMTVGVVANVCYFTTVCGGTCDNPVLHNNDSLIIWNDCNAHYGIGTSYCPGRLLFGVYNAVLMHLFGRSMVVLLIANMVMIQLALVLGSLITYNLTDNKRAAGISICAAASVCYMLSMGTLLLRDAWLIFSMALAGYGLTSKTKNGLACVLISAVLIASIRNNWTWAIIIGIAAKYAYMYVYVKRAERHGYSKI